MDKASVEICIALCIVDRLVDAAWRGTSNIKKHCKDPKVVSTWGPNVGSIFLHICNRLAGRQDLRFRANPQTYSVLLKNISENGLEGG
jgi:hypothetical protein